MVRLIFIFSSLIALIPILQDSNDRELLTREEIMATAKLITDHTWVCQEENRRAPCVTEAPYQCDWEVGEQVTGIAYDWGGIDGTEEFDHKLAEGQAAGSHSRHGITQCTAGIDCSGFVSRCWGISRVLEKCSTRNIREKIGARPKYNWYSDMKAGDALVKPGSHIVLFVGYRADGNPIVYEAAGSHGRVIYNDWSTWSRFQDYYPLEYRDLIKE